MKGGLFTACFVLHVKFPRKIGNDTTKLRIERGFGQIVFTLGPIRLYIAVLAYIGVD